MIDGGQTGLAVLHSSGAHSVIWGFSLLLWLQLPSQLLIGKPSHVHHATPHLFVLLSLTT